MHAVDQRASMRIHRQDGGGQHHQQHARHPQRYHSSNGQQQHHAPPPGHSSAVSFLRGIPMSIDPGVAPSPLFPFVSFETAVRLAARGGGGEEEAAYWAHMKQAACVAFLSNIPMGTETADQRPQPVLNLPMAYFQQQQQPSQQQYQWPRAPLATSADSSKLPQTQPALAHQTSLPAGAPSLVHASSLQPVAGSRESSGAGQGPLAQGELLLFPSSTPPPPHSNSGSITPPQSQAASSLQPLPLRIQTPPLLMGLGSTSAGQLAVGAHLFHNSLLFPSTLATPIELSRATTQHQQNGIHLPGLDMRMGRATSEYASHANGPGYFPRAPPLTQQNSEEAVAHAQAQLQAQASEDTHRSPKVERLGAGAEQTNAQPEADNMSLLFPPSNGGPMRTPFRPSAPGEIPSTQAQAAQPSKHVRPDGTGQGLSDHDALFLSAPSAATPHEEWERQLLARGLIDPHARLIYTSGQADGATAGAPTMLSSLQPWIAREHSSTNSSATGTPHLAAKSRSGSFSMDPLSLSPHGLDQGGPSMHLQLQRAAGGKNALLSMAAAAAAALEAEEDSDDSRFSSGGIFGKRKGTSYGYLLPCSYAAKRAAAAVQAKTALARAERDVSGDRDSTSGGDLPSLSLHPSQVDTNDAYDPFFLDDPNIKSGKHRVVLNLPGFMSSLISYVRTKELKQELNETFALRHEEWLNPAARMSLSKIRKVKQLLLDIGVALDLEISTVAVSYIYYEKLLAANAVDKTNRKLMAAACLLLAFKWTEGSTLANRKKSMQALFHACEKTLYVSRSQVLKAEFPVYQQLAFNLVVSTEHVLHHFRQCLSKLDTVPQDYLHLEWSVVIPPEPSRNIELLPGL